MSSARMKIPLLDLAAQNGPMREEILAAIANALTRRSRAQKRTAGKRADARASGHATFTRRNNRPVDLSTAWQIDATL